MPKPLPEPKPCPWCGKNPTVERWFNMQLWLVECKNKRCKVVPSAFGFQTERGALNAWNNRKGCK